MEESARGMIEPDAWPVLRCAQPLLPPRARSLFCRGVTGVLFRTASSPLLYSDFAALLFPGLRALGIDAVLAPLPAEANAIVPFLRHLNRQAGSAVFQFGGNPVPEEDWDAEDRQSGQPAQEDRRRIVVRQGALQRIEPTEVRWENAAQQVFSATPAEFRELFSFGLRLRRVPGKETRRACLLASIQRAVVYRLAFPDLAVSDARGDQEERASAAQFLAEAAGKQRDPISLRWRQAAIYLAQGNAADAWQRLYDASLRALNLPDPIMDIFDSNASLTNLQIRELTYLARAGHRDLKVYAIHRLAQEREPFTVRQTLEPFTLYPDPLVRAAASVKGL